MKTRPHHLLRAMQVGILCATLALLTACGGGNDNNNGASNPPPTTTPTFQVVSFGDSLSDVGTYAPVAQAAGGGRFTTNPGQVWTQDVANFYGGKLTAAVTGGYGFPLTAHADGLGYAQGGARVTDPNGIDFKSNGLGATTVPVVTQLQNYLAAHVNFNSGQLVLLQGGGSDILIHAQAVAGGAETLSQAQAATTLAAQQLAGIAGKILQAGATHLVVQNMPNIGASPRGIRSGDGGALLTGLSQTFNAALTSALQTSGIQNKVITFDAFTFINNAIANFQANGFQVSNTGTGCNLQLLSQEVSVSALFCSPKTYTTPNADQTFMFADDIHPTTHLHSLIASSVEQAIAASK